MAYENIDLLKKKAERLREPRYGIAQILRDRKADKLEQQIAESEKRNQTNRQQELAMLLRGAETGVTGGPGMGMGALRTKPASEFMPTDPEVQALAAKLRLDRAGGTNQPSNVQEWEYYNKLPQQDQERYLTLRRGIDTMNLGDRYAIPSQASPGQEIGSFEAGIRPQDQPALRGEQAAAVQEARTAALPEQLAIENAAAVERENSLAVAPRGRDADSALMLLDMAEPLLENATGSDLGAIRDRLAGVFGVSTEGGEAAAQLKAIGGLLISKMPRMQGPQSNLDVQLYREMAGQIGDPTVPNDVRRAAIQTIRELNQKYATQQAPADDPITAADEILRRAGIIQ